MTLTLTQLAQFTLGAVLIVLLPGPNSLFVATTAAKVSRAAGWRAALGVFIGDGVLMMLAVLGAGTLLAGFGLGGLLYTLNARRLVSWLGEAGLASGGGMVLAAAFGLALAHLATPGTARQEAASLLRR